MDNNFKNSSAKKNKGVSRRDFFKAVGAAGLAAGTVGTGTVLGATPAFAYEKTSSSIINFSIKKVDKPPYDLYPYADGSKTPRFPSSKIAFQNKNLFNQKFGGKPWYVPYSQNRAKKMMDGEGGFSLRDIAFGASAEKSSGNSILMDWGTDYENSYVKKHGKWKDTPENNSLSVKKVASFFGSGATGICEVKEQWFYTHEHDVPIIFSDKHDKPIKGEDARIIPKSMKWAIVMLPPMDGNLSRFSPTRLGSVPDNLGYSRMSELTSKVADFIRGLGYNAIPLGNDHALSVPMAVDAGLGEVGRHGLLINPEFGSMNKICKVITDLPLKPDKPIQFGAAEFCRTCKKCAETCPSQSISHETDPDYKVKCESNFPGPKKWFVNTWTCLEFWTQNGGGCVVCQHACPYSKPQTWVHDVVKGVSSKTTLFNPVFTRLDDAFGYGKSGFDYTKEDMERWWSDKEWTRPYTWPRTGYTTK